MRHVTIRVYGIEAEAERQDTDVWTIAYPWGTERFEGSPAELRERMKDALKSRQKEEANEDA